VTVLQEFHSRLNYAKACGQRVAEFRVSPEVWDEFVRDVEPYIVLTGDNNGSDWIRYAGVKIRRDEIEPYIQPEYEEDR